MRYLFVSPEKVAQDQYRHGTIFRFAGALLLVGMVLQIPFLFFGVLGWKEFRDRNAEQASLRAEWSELQKANVPLKETRQKLAQIRQWEPITYHRIPISSLLNAVQISIPPAAVLDSISIEAEQFDYLPVQEGTYRVPRNYRLVLQGLERADEGDTLQIFCDALQKRLFTSRRPCAAGTYKLGITSVDFSCHKTRRIKPYATCGQTSPEESNPRSRGRTAKTNRPIRPEAGANTLGCNCAS